ncbi:MAG: hypothetical protein MUF21_11800, partial [Gemmatimonadaceae bacterium]|nr:hypothetical protein [Gemmatimonadaceae bacterium]
MRQLTRAVATATCALLVHPVARGATLPAQGAPADSAVAYLDSVAAIVTRSHWDTAAVGARWQALHRTLRDSLRADPSLDQARR